MMIMSVAVMVEEVHQRAGEEQQIGRVAQDPREVTPVFAEQPEERR
jgi:hypothetical protein